ncbi:hypothetical protein [Halorientalis pallida]|uniref:Uncharacterized protein n=1 Tax=Halorientalis pallida TaxID=2479928 RepID=A0A498KVQ7_9EURY|nr:hypothetical protein [Halorientalis pallida]RXK48679.1 hypothetical protein EAF64_13485 [Halorientalis pallida]
MTAVLLLLALGCTGSANAVSSLAENESTIANNTTQSSGFSEPRISVSVNNREVQNGTRIMTGEDPDLSVNIRSTSPIESVIIRIDGQTRYLYSPNSTNFSATNALELRDGGHRVTVISTGNITTVYSVTIIEDAIAPRIRFEEPFVTRGAEPPNQNYTINTSKIALRGQLIDRSSVQQIIIEHRYEYTFSGRQTDRSRYVIEDPNGSFAQQLTLGPNRKKQTNGTNFVSIDLVDANDNRRTYDFILNISDRRPPNIEILEVTPVYEQSAVAAEIRVTDNVGISLFGQRLGSGNNTGFQSYYSENDIYQQRREYETTIEFPASIAGNGIKLWATDLVGNNVTTNYSLAYENFVEPKITINTKTTQALGEQRARVVGTIDQGLFSQVEIEARSNDGTLSDIIAVQSGEESNTIQFNETVQVNSYPTSVLIRARDITGTEHSKKYQITRTDPPKSPEPTPDVPTRTVSTTTPSESTTTKNGYRTPVSTSTPQETATARGSIETTHTTKRFSPVESVLGYVVSLLPYTLSSAIFTILLYIIARRSLTS